jgi:hypothetical protein
MVVIVSLLLPFFFCRYSFSPQGTGNPGGKDVSTTNGLLAILITNLLPGASVEAKYELNKAVIQKSDNGALKALAGLFALPQGISVFTREFFKGSMGSHYYDNPVMADAFINTLLGYLGGNVISGTMDLIPVRTTQAISKIINFEKGITNEALEHGQFFSKEGDLIGDTIVGTESSIDISSYKDMAKDSIYTHNHPGNRQFSLQDIQTAAGFDMAEVRAVTPSGKVYSMKRGIDGWKITDPRAIEMAQTMAQSELSSDPVARQFFQEGNQEAVWNMLFEKIAKSIGGEYTVIN